MPTRADGLAFLQGRPYYSLASETGQAVTDTSLGWGPVLDNALRALGVSEANLASPTIDQAHASAFFAYLRYYALEQVVTDLALDIDVSVASNDATAKRSQLFAQVQKLLEQARVTIAELSEPLSGAPQIGTILQTAPILPKSWQPDPNGRGYRGDPLLRPGQRVSG